MTRSEQILALLGTDAALGRLPVLLPIEAKQKGPKVPGWPKLTWAETQTPEWLAALDRHRNTGVALGAQSGGLCTLDVDNEECGPEFLALNPKLAGSLRTRGKKGFQLWMWLFPDAKQAAEGLPDYPPARMNITHATRVVEQFTDGGGITTTPYVCAEWRAGGAQSVVAGVHPDDEVLPDGTTRPRWYQVVVEAPPVAVGFSEIIWPDSWVLPWVKEWEQIRAARESAGAQATAAIYGRAFTMGKEGPVMGEHFWAARFVEKHDLLFDAVSDSFFVYKEATGAWEPRSRAQVGNFVSRYLVQQSAGDGLEFLQGNSARSWPKVNSLLSYIEGLVTEQNPFPRAKGMIHCRNGMVDIRGPVPVLEAFAPRFRSRNPLPWDFTPGAVCPNFKAVLLESALDADDILTVQKCAGSFVLGTNLMQRIVILTGTPQGGKSTLARVFQRIIGDHNVAMLRTEQLGERFEMGAYLGKNLLTAPDVDGGFLKTKGASKLKSLTGSDFIEAELKGGGREMFEGSLNVLITCNSRLTMRLEEDADAWRRRLILIGYNRPKCATPIPDLVDKLLLGCAELGWVPEASGVLNWCIEGARLLFADAAKGGKVVLSQQQEGRIEALLSESESVRHFIETQVVPTERGEPDDANITTEELKDGYIAYCAEQGWNAEPDNVFHNRLRELVTRVHRRATSNGLQREVPGSDRKKWHTGYNHMRLRSEALEGVA